MKQLQATITSKGQVTIPKEVRQRLGLDAHDKVIFVLEDDGDVRLRAPQYPTIASLRGQAGSLGRKLSWDEMLRIAREDRMRPEATDQP